MTKLSTDRWMSWEGGVDLVACTHAGLTMPNVIVHVARLVHTPIGSAASGMVMFQPDPAGSPLVMGFVSTQAQIGRYFGPTIFAGTPFEPAPVLDARIEIEVASTYVGATVTVGGHVLRTRLEELAAPTLVQRPPGGLTPFWQQGLESVASRARLWVDGREISILVPPVGISGGPAAVFAPAGIYAR
jgi:hypothetical protein